MSNPVETYDLGEIGRDYIDSYIRNGAGFFTTLKRISLRKGECFAPLPSGLSINRVHDLDLGGFGDEGIKIDKWLVGHLLEMGERYPSSMMIMQNYLLSESDMGWGKRLDCEFYSEGKIYYAVPASRFSEDLG